MYPASNFSRDGCVKWGLLNQFKHFQCTRVIDYRLNGYMHHKKNYYNIKKFFVKVGVSKVHLGVELRM